MKRTAEDKMIRAMDDISELCIKVFRKYLPKGYFFDDIESGRLGCEYRNMDEGVFGFRLAIFDQNCQQWTSLRFSFAFNTDDMYSDETFWAFQDYVDEFIDDVMDTLCPDYPYKKLRQYRALSTLITNRVPMGLIYEYRAYEDEQRELIRKQARKDNEEYFASLVNPKYVTLD